MRIIRVFNEKYSTRIHAHTLLHTTVRFSATLKCFLRVNPFHKHYDMLSRGSYAASSQNISVIARARAFGAALLIRQNGLKKENRVASALIDATPSAPRIAHRVHVVTMRHTHNMQLTRIWRRQPAITSSSRTTCASFLRQSCFNGKTTTRNMHEYPNRNVAHTRLISVGNANQAPYGQCVMSTRIGERASARLFLALFILGTSGPSSSLCLYQSSARSCSTIYYDLIIG